MKGNVQDLGCDNANKKFARLLSSPGGEKCYKAYTDSLYYAVQVYVNLQLSHRKFY